MQYLITGCSSGLGLSLARAVLAHIHSKDDKLIATSRNPSSTLSLVQEMTSHPNAVWERLDVASATLEADISSIIAKHGAVDVLINNAGYAIGGVFEATPLDKVRAQFETNFFGVVRLTQTLLPSMRERKTGTIVNISSDVVWKTHPGTGIYASTKCALEAISEALAAEVAAFGVRVLIVQPGATRTSFLDPAKAAESLLPCPDAYRGSVVDYVLQAFATGHGAQAVDPDRAADAIVREVLVPSEVVLDGRNGVSSSILRLQIGREAVEDVQAKVKAVQAEAAVVRDVALACDY